MLNDRLYPFWGVLTEALRTGLPQTEVKGGDNTFEILYSDPDRLRLFLSGMTGVSMGSARAIAQKFPWRNHKSFIDVGTAQGCISINGVQSYILKKYPYLNGNTEWNIQLESFYGRSGITYD